MKLFEYPQAIANLREELVHLEVLLLDDQENLKCIESNIDSLIANDSSLKNDAQRKAKKIELLQSNPDYIYKNSQYRGLKMKVKILEIKLNQRIDEFSVAKIEERKSIALMSQMANV